MAEQLPALTTYKEPADCTECAASCPFKVAGCAYDLALEAANLADKLDELGIQFDTSQLEAEVYPKAKACREKVCGQIREENELTLLAAKVLSRAPVLARVKQYLAQDAHPAPVPIPATAPAQAMQVVQVVPDAVVRSTRGRNDLYVNDGDEAAEAQLRADPLAKSVVVSPKCKVANLPEYAARMAAHFGQAPFEACLAVVGKYWKDNRDYCQVRVWYRGELGMKEALATLKPPVEASAPNLPVGVEAAA